MLSEGYEGSDASARGLPTSGGSPTRGAMAWAGWGCRRGDPNVMTNSLALTMDGWNLFRCIQAKGIDHCQTVTYQYN